jgi:hypothetical protein
MCQLYSNSSACQNKQEVEKQEFFLATAAIADIHIIEYKFSAVASMEL